MVLVNISEIINLCKGNDQQYNLM